MVSVSKGWSLPEILTAVVGVVLPLLVKVKVDLCLVSDHRSPAIVKDNAHGSATLSLATYFTI